ncbi:unnamed protein product [Fasciola hepatica]|uniref:Uncharacterized protein n=1 Tax=Fasciola hepatica TaxID=6192 RepID=A0ABC9HI30_FASHE
MTVPPVHLRALPSELNRMFLCIKNEIFKQADSEQQREGGESNTTASLGGTSTPSHHMAFFTFSVMCLGLIR